MSPWWLHSIYLSSPLLFKISSFTQNMLFSYNKTLLSLIYQFSIGIFFLYLILCSQSPACAGKTTHPLHCNLVAQDHPRVCGKNRIFSASIKIWLGSPSRVREKRIDYTDIAILSGITPACAGKTVRVIWLMAWLGDHPRVCGKNRGIVQLVDVSTGLPPHMREKLKRRHHLRRLSRITPACAGKTQWSR